MGYFPNGSAGDRYQAQYCDRCINWRETSPGSGNWGCPIMDLHTEWNYEQHDIGLIERAKKHALDNFIERKKDTFCDKCKMFIENDDV